jgi:hypothetical protein
MKIIVPCAGRSSRFPNMAPKWMLPDNDGLPMVYKAVQGLGAKVDDFIFTILAEHEERFQARAGLRAAFGQEVNTVILDEPTRSQSETVAQTLLKSGIDEPFMVKDSDNYFEVAHLNQSYNYVCVASLSSFTQVNPQNKSYVQVDQEDVIVNFREKQVISDLFSVGGYYFTSPKEFLGAYDELMGQPRLSAGELYLSEIIGYLAMQGSVFRIQRIKQYQDWGTVHEWRDYLQGRRVFFVSIDGFLFEQGSPYFKPGFDAVKPNPVAVETVQKLASEGQTLFYLSIRSPELEALTKQQIAEAGLPERPIQFGCDLAQWTLLTAPHPNQPFRTSHAIEIAADDPNMAEKLEIER